MTRTLKVAKKANFVANNFYKVILCLPKASRVNRYWFLLSFLTQFCSSILSVLNHRAVALNGRENTAQDARRALSLSLALSQ